MKQRIHLNLLLILIAVNSLLINAFGQDYPGFVFIPQGAYHMAGEVEPHEFGNTKIVSVDAFWLMEYEVSNLEYAEFLYNPRINGQDSLHAIAYPDTSRWIMPYAFYEPYAEYYHTNPAFHHYPVVNISHQAAQLFCDWRNSLIDDEEGKYRLPTEAEWEMAARGGLDMSRYPWGGLYLRNNKGEAQCNFRRVGDENIFRGESGEFIVDAWALPEGNVAPVPVHSFEPNEYGLYNMSGNVAEMVAEKEVTRGGGFMSPGGEVTVSFRKPHDGEAAPWVGFRLLKETSPADFQKKKRKRSRSKRGEGTLMGVQ